MKTRTAVIAAFVSLISWVELFVILGSDAKPICDPAKGQAETAEFYNERAKGKAKTGDLWGAENDFSCSLKINPNNVDVIISYGKVVGTLKDYELAFKYFDHALSIIPKSVDALLYRGVARMHLKDFKGANKDFSQVIKIAPNDFRGYKERGFSKRQSVSWAKRNNGGISMYFLNKSACNDYKKASALGDLETEKWLATKGGAWCRDM